MSLCRNKEPRPQDTLQALHAVHRDMMQSTWGEERKLDEMRYFIQPYYNFWGGHTIYILPQSFSSEPSTQSFCRSHLRSRWMHSPLAQENCFEEQGLGTSGPCGVTAGLTVVPDKTHEQNNITLFNFHKYLSKKKRSTITYPKHSFYIIFGMRSIVKPQYISKLWY